MPKQQKAKSAKGARNDARKNGKSFKKNPGKPHHKGNDPGFNVLLGKGMYTKFVNDMKPAKVKARERSEEQNRKRKKNSRARNLELSAADS